MKRAWRFAYTAAAIAITAFGIVAPGCSSDDDSSAAPDNDASTGSPDAITCQLEGAHNGGSCFPVGPTLCFQQCPSGGGCVCTEDKAHPGADAGIWVCTSDTSCFPDASPVDFDATEPPFDANVGFDAGVDADIDDASDAGADADAE